MCAKVAAFVADFVTEPCCDNSVTKSALPGYLYDNEKRCDVDHITRRAPLLPQSWDLICVGPDLGDAEHEIEGYLGMTIAMLDTPRLRAGRWSVRDVDGGQGC